MFVTGTFDRWLKLQELHREADGSFSKTVTLPIEKTEFKYVVDGQWLLDESAKIENDLHGNKNNFLNAEDIAAHASSASSGAGAATGHTRQTSMPGEYPPTPSENTALESAGPLGSPGAAQTSILSSSDASHTKKATEHARDAPVTDLSSLPGGASTGDSAISQKDTETDKVHGGTSQLMGVSAATHVSELRTIPGTRIPTELELAEKRTGDITLADSPTTATNPDKALPQHAPDASFNEFVTSQPRAQSDYVPVSTIRLESTMKNHGIGKQTSTDDAAQSRSNVLAESSLLSGSQVAAKESSAGTLKESSISAPTGAVLGSVVSGTLADKTGVRKDTRPSERTDEREKPGEPAPTPADTKETVASEPEASELDKKIQQELPTVKETKDKPAAGEKSSSPQSKSGDTQKAQTQTPSTTAASTPAKSTTSASGTPKSEKKKGFLNKLKKAFK